MDASPSPQASEPDDSPPGTRTYITEREAGDPEQVVARFRCESPDGWTATGALSQTSRGLGVSQLSVEPGLVDGEPGHITSTLLRQIPTGAILAAAQAAGIAVLDTNALVPREEKRQPGRQPLSDDLLVEVAEQYLAETAPGKPRGANTRLAEHFGKPVPTISRWVMRARADGWLGPAVPGREGGEPGPRLLAGYAQHPVPERMPDGTINVWVPPKVETEEEAERLREHTLRAWKSHQAPAE